MNNHDSVMTNFLPIVPHNNQPSDTPNAAEAIRRHAAFKPTLVRYLWRRAQEVDAESENRKRQALNDRILADNSVS